MAEEVLQRVYLKILEGKAPFEERSTFKTWLFAVIRKTAAEEYRRRVIHRLRFLGIDQAIEFRSNDDQPDESIEQADLQEIFRGALGLLPKRQGEVIHLVFYQDMTIEESANVLGISVGSARTHYERGKRKLREQLEQSKDFHETRITRPTHSESIPEAQTR